MDKDRSQEIAVGLIERLEDGWNAADGEAFGAPFAQDADFVDIRGDYHKSREAIAKGHQGIFDTIYKNSRVTYTLHQARGLTDGVILAHVRGNLSAPSGPLAGEHSSIATLVLVHRDEDWKIADFHNTLVTPPR